MQNAPNAGTSYVSNGKLDKTITYNVRLFFMPRRKSLETDPI